MTKAFICSSLCQMIDGLYLKLNISDLERRVPLKAAVFANLSEV